MTDTSIGERLRERRTYHDMTQGQLADAAEVSIDTVRKLEQGQRQTTSIATLHALAAALDTTPGDLLGKTATLSHASDTSGVRAIARRLTAVHDLLDEDLQPPEATVDALQRTSTYGWGAYWAGRYAELGSLLPVALSDVTAVVHHAAAGELGRAHGIAAQIHHLTGYTLVQLGHPDPAYTALRAAIRHAELGEDPLRVAVTRGAMAWLLLTDGRPSEAHRVAAHAALEHDPDELGGAAPAVSVWGGLMLTAATASARAGDPVAAAEFVAEASEAATRIGDVDRSDYDWPFGPSQVVMQGADVSIVAEDPERALAWAREMPRRSTLPLAARARHLADVAQAHQRLGHDDQALSSLLTIERVAPEWLRWQPLPKAITRELLDQERRRRSSGELHQFAERLGVLTV